MKKFLFMMLMALMPLANFAQGMSDQQVMSFIAAEAKQDCGWYQNQPPHAPHCLRKLVRRARHKRSDSAFKCTRHQQHVACCIWRCWSNNPCRTEQPQAA